MTALREQISLLKEFLRSDFRRAVLRCTAWFLGAAALGVVLGLLYPDMVAQTVESFSQMVDEAGIVNEDGSFSLFALLANNWWAMLLSAAYGFLPFAFLPLFSLVSNSMLIGVLAAWYHANGVSLVLYLAALIPHGIFELPALVISVACGEYLCRNVNRLVVGSEKRLPMAALLCDLLRVMLFVVAPLVLTAGILEAYVTPLVVSLFL